MSINFEHIHKRFNGEVLNLCKSCGGRCEKTLISTFLPGEVEYIAKKMNLSTLEFIEKFCNAINFRGNNIYILRAGVCPFLNTRYRCILEKLNCKPTLCMLYPVLLGKSDNKVRTYVDDYCPMYKKIGKSFKNTAFEICEDITEEIPEWWFDFVSKYDSAVYEYSKLEKFRHRKKISLAELKACVLKSHS